MSDRPVCPECSGYGIIRIFYKKVDWYKTNRKDDGKRYYMDAWQDKPCPRCQVRDVAKGGNK